jgi:TetR/AcrR family transcriptional regulator, transcriptional repressor for nem operon
MPVSFLSIDRFQVDAMRDAILRAAEARMRRDGFHGFSFRDLATDVGIKSASVHYHFPTKADLGVSLMRNYQEHMLAAFGDAEDDRTLADKLGAVRDAYRKKLSKAGICLCGILAAEHAGLPAPVGEALKSYFVACRNWLISAFAGAGAGEPEKRALVFSSAVQGALLMSHAMGDQALFNRLAEEAIRAQEQSGVRRGSAKGQRG